MTSVERVEVDAAGAVDQYPEHAAVELDVPQLEAGGGEQGSTKFADRLCRTAITTSSSRQGPNDVQTKAWAPCRRRKAHARHTTGRPRARRPVKYSPEDPIAASTVRSHPMAVRDG